MSPEVAAIVGGAVGGLVGATGAVIATVLDRRARRAADEADAIEHSAWQVAAIVGQLIVSVVGIPGALGGWAGRTRRLLLAPASAEAVPERYAVIQSQLAVPYAFIHARAARFPLVDATVGRLLELSTEIVTAATEGRLAAAQAQIADRYSELYDELHTSVGTDVLH